MTPGNNDPDTPIRFREFAERFLADESLPIDEWQLRFLEGLRSGRVVTFGTPARRSDGWVRRLVEARAAELERIALEADRLLADELEAFKTRRGEMWRAMADEVRARMGVDMASGPDQTAFGCGCGEWFESLEALANHAIRGHRWPPESLL